MRGRMGEVDRELRSRPRVSDRRHPATVVLHHFTYQRQAQTEAAAVAATALEPLEDQFGLVRGESGPVIADGQHNLASRSNGFHDDFDAAFRTGMVQGVVDECADHPAQGARGAENEMITAPAAQVKPDRSGLRPDGLGRDHGFGHGGEVDQFACRIRALQLCRREKVLYHLTELSRVGDQGGKLVIEAGWLRLAGKKLRADVQPGQRSAQLVARLGHEAALPAQCLSQRRDRAAGQHLTGRHGDDQADDLGHREYEVRQVPFLPLVAQVHGRLENGGATAFGADEIGALTDLPFSDQHRATRRHPSQVGSHREPGRRVRCTLQDTAVQSEHPYGRRRVIDAACRHGRREVALGVPALADRQGEAHQNADEQHGAGDRAGDLRGEPPRRPAEFPLFALLRGQRLPAW